MQFADPKNDLAFKKLFGDEQHSEILISFLNAVLDFTGEQAIVEVTLASPYQVPRIPELKETILDIKAKNKGGESFIVEMQKKDLGDFTKRSLYYTSKAYVEQLPKGKDYTRLKRVYFIGLLNFNIFENSNYISRHLIVNQETQTQDLSDFEFTFIELPKFNKPLEALESTLDKWIYFLKHAQDLTMIPQTYANLHTFQEAFNIVTQTSWNTKELEVYDYITLKEFDELNALRTAEKKGLQKGIEQGIEKGIEQGIKQGVKEVAHNLLKANIPLETIMLSTGLTKEEIASIKKETL